MSVGECPGSKINYAMLYYLARGFNNNIMIGHGVQRFIATMKEQIHVLR